MSVESIARLSLPEAYRLLLTLAQDDPSALGLRHKGQIRFGFDYHFDLWLAMNSNYVVDQKNGTVMIGPSTLRLTTFYTEIEKRDALIRRLLIRGLVGKDPFTR